MNAAIKKIVRDRANHCCEYCGLLQFHSPLTPLHIEHIIPIKHGGLDETQNLALACIDCNLAKSSNIAGLDPLTRTLTELFHPRNHHWSDHFERQGQIIAGRTPIGRTTVYVLNMNSDERVELRFLITAEEK